MILVPVLSSKNTGSCFSIELNIHHTLLWVDSIRIRNQENNAGHSDDLEQIDDFNLQDDHVVIFIWIETLIFVLISFYELFLSSKLDLTTKAKYRGEN